MSEWKLTINELPTQGTKILCFNNGDVWVAQRFQECWFPIPFLDSEYASYEAPDQWSYIDLPEGYTGKMRVKPEGRSPILDIDEWEKKHPKAFVQFKKTMKKEMDSRDKK